jgi:ankyrin repeat protein
LQTGQSFEITLSHDARSALMYAAANGSSAMIRLLLDAGADPFQADSKGMRAVDYLLGFGPNAANTHLDAQQKAEALRLLF